MADNISEELKNVRSLEDVVQLLSILFTNLNNQNEMYYDMFLNPVPMDLELERYNEEGVLETVTIPNRAKDNIRAYSGAGNPNGVVSATAGALYIDTSSYSLYFKGYGADSSGWILVWSALNLVAGRNYLTPNGDGSNLVSLNASNINSGILLPAFGGTGTSNISGILKGNGASACTAAVDGVDYLGPNSFTGIICYYPVYDASAPNGGIPTGWLRCDGYGSYSRTLYSRLFNKIGTTYGAGDGSTTFGVPNLIDVYIKCWDGSREFGTKQLNQVGKHVHSLTGETSEESEHTHGRGTMNITGRFWKSNSQDIGGGEGAFGNPSGGGSFAGGANSGWGYSTIQFDASRSWTGVTSGGTPHSHTLTGTTAENVTADEGGKNEVDNVMLVPIIKY